MLKSMCLSLLVLCVASPAAAQSWPSPIIYVKGSLFLKGPITDVTGLIDAAGFEYVWPTPKKGTPLSDFLFRGAMTGVGHPTALGLTGDGQQFVGPTAMSCTPCLGGQQVIVGGDFSFATLPSVVWKGVTYTATEWDNGGQSMSLWGYNVVTLPLTARGSSIAFKVSLYLDQRIVLSRDDFAPLYVAVVGIGSATVRLATVTNAAGQVEYWFDPSSYSLDVKFDPSSGRPCYDRSCFSQ